LYVFVSRAMVLTPNPVFTVPRDTEFVWGVFVENGNEALARGDKELARFRFVDGGVRTGGNGKTLDHLAAVCDSALRASVGCALDGECRGSAGWHDGAARFDAEPVLAETVRRSRTRWSFLSLRHQARATKWAPPFRKRCWHFSADCEAVS
jgi:hypothetical protein